MVYKTGVKLLPKVYHVLYKKTLCAKSNMLELSETQDITFHRKSIEWIKFLWLPPKFCGPNGVDQQNHTCFVSGCEQDYNWSKENH